jgi:hypothetical protein
MESDVNGLTVYYGLFEKCVISPPDDVIVCELFDWPGWLYDSSKGKNEEKNEGEKW